MEKQHEKTLDISFDHGLIHLDRDLKIDRITAIEWHPCTRLMELDLGSAVFSIGVLHRIQCILPDGFLYYWCFEPYA